MLSKTLSEGIDRYQIGPMLRALRLRKKMGLVELSSHTGLSAALLSKLERGKLFPTLPTLLRIALVFGVGLEHFFVEEKKRDIGIVRQSERVRFPEKPNSRDVNYYFECLDFNSNDRKTNSFYAEFEPVQRERVRTHQHSGREFIYVLKGKLGLLIGSDSLELEPGDSIHFDSSLTHGYRSAGAKTCAAIVVVIP